MNFFSNDFSPSHAFNTSIITDAERTLRSFLTSDFQLQTAQTILSEWNNSNSITALISQWTKQQASTPSSGSQEISLLLYNISSLRQHFHDLLAYITESFPTIWALTGLHFDDTSNYHLSSFFKSRYTIYYQRGSNQCGGVCLAIARELPHRIVSQFAGRQNLIVADIFILDRTFTLAVVYSPPSESVPITVLDHLYDYNRDLILIGDLNARHSSWHDVVTNPQGQRLANWIEGNDNLHVFNSAQPTSARSDAIIDLVIAPSHVSNELACVDHTIHVTDHYPVRWILSSLSLTQLSKFPVKRIDWPVLQCILHLKQDFFFSLAETMNNEPTNFVVLYESLLVALQERCTSTHLTTSYRPSLPSYLVTVIKYRRKILAAFRFTRSIEYRICLQSLNKYIHNELRSIKRSQWLNFCFRLDPKNTNQFWRHSKNLFKRKPLGIQCFVDKNNNRVLTDPAAMIDHAYAYYSESLTEKDFPSQKPDVHEFTQHLHSRLAELPSKSLRFTINNLHRSIRQLKAKSSSGHEKMSNKLIKSIPISHYSFILQTFNRFLLANSYPDHWKLSKMILLPKEKNTFPSIDQTRPISLLPCLGKVFERCFLIHLRQWITDHAILPSEQSGFRQGHSTTNRFAHFLQHLTSGLQQQTASLVLYIDFTKAFDQLWHDALIYKLYRLQCPSELVNFVIEYLRNRKCFISMHQLISPLISVGKGVPQGSCLGPILFLLFHSELPQAIPSASHCHLFADDLAVVVHASPWWHRTQFAHQMANLGQNVLHEIGRYATDWKQPINLAKTQWQWIHRRVTIPTLSLSLHGHPIERTRLFKYLGYHVDERLSFNSHCRKMLETIQKNSTILKYVSRSHTSCKRARELLSNAFIHPYFQLLYVIWPLLSPYAIEQIEAKHRQISRLINNWFDATVDEVRCFPNYQTAETKAKRFLRRFLDKAFVSTPDLFHDYIISKTMPLYLHMHYHDDVFIQHLPRGRLNRYVRTWMSPHASTHSRLYLDRLFSLLARLT